MQVFLWEPGAPRPTVFRVPTPGFEPTIGVIETYDGSPLTPGLHGFAPAMKTSTQTAETIMALVHAAALVRAEEW